MVVLLGNSLVLSWDDSLVLRGDKSRILYGDFLVLRGGSDGDGGGDEGEQLDLALIGMS